MDSNNNRVILMCVHDPDQPAWLATKLVTFIA